MRIYIGSDKRGEELRPKITSYLVGLGFDVEDLGVNVDFPLIAEEVSKKVLGSKGSAGILMCGTGQGMAMKANRFSGIRAAVCNTIEDAKQAREHLDANIVTTNADNVSYDLAKEIVRTFLTTEFSKKERYERRIKQSD